MRFPLTKVLIFVAVFCTFVFGAGFLASQHRVPRASGRVTTRVVAMSGEQLRTLFDGLSPVARYEWKSLSASTILKSGTCRTQTKESNFERFLIALGLETIAYAQCTCPPSNCGGQYECYDSTTCDPCYGIVSNPDFECGPMNQGEMEDGTGCVFCCGSLCNRPICKD